MRLLRSYGLSAVLIGGLVAFLSLWLVMCKGDGGDAGDYDGTCYMCSSICSSCDATAQQACLTECDQCQGYSDCFMHLEAQQDGWGCETGHGHWIGDECQ
mgnify:CR=1 FL=1